MSEDAAPAPETTEATEPTPESAVEALPEPEDSGVSFTDALEQALSKMVNAAEAIPEPEPEPEPETNNTVTEEEVEEAADEVPGFGLISAVAAIGAVLLLRRRL